MPDDPNKRMDEMLRAYAEERRKAPEVQLHPTTRNLLQGEVARVFGHAAAPRPWWQRLRAFWPQIAFGSSLCLILGIAILSLRQPNRESDASAPAAKPEAETLNYRSEPAAIESQMREDVAGQQPAPTLSAPPADPKATTEGDSALGFEAEVKQKRVLAPEQAQSRNFSRERVLAEESALRPSVGQSAPTKLNEERLADTSPTDAASAPAAESTVRLQKKLDVQPTARSDRAPRDEAAPLTAFEQRGSVKDAELNVSATAPATVPSLAKQERLSRAAELTNLGAARRLSFVQVSNTAASARYATVGAKATSQAQTLLSNFRVEQLGNNVQFVDNDGSIYVGNIEATNSPPIILGAPLQTGNSAVNLDASAAYYFRVAGTNRTLGQDVVLTGNYFAQTNLGPTSLDTFAISPDAKSQQTQARHLIIGNATIGGSNQVPVQAVATEP